MTGATPAACYAHSNNRSDTAGIIAQLGKPLAGNGVDLVLGPGRSAIYKATAAAGFDLDAVEGVCAGGDVDSLDVLDHITHLVDKSLVSTQEEADGPLRYALLETIREYGMERLAEAGETGAYGLLHGANVLPREGPASRPELPLPLTMAGEEKPRATLTSFGLDPELGGIGLALTRREIAAAGTRLTGGNRTFEIVEELTAHS